jgi:outer membrane autotransporter protein
VGICGPTRGQILRAVLLGTTAAAALCLGARVASSDATWIGTTSGWTTGANWSTGTMPGGNEIATFGTAPNTFLTIDPSATSIGTLQFSSTADTYVFDFDIGGTFAVTGGGILNGSANVQVFLSNSALNFTGGTVTGAVELHNSGALSFTNANAGSASILNFTNATIDFNAGSTAGNATIGNFSSGMIHFNAGSTAGAATINNSGGFISFNGDARGGTARIDNLGGLVNFNDSSTAGNATIVNDGLGSSIIFSGTSTAGEATITNTGGVIIFIDSASAGSANIANDPTSVQSRTIEFNDTSTAGSATLTTANGARINFFNNSTGGTATLIANNGGAIRFFDSALGDRARLIANAGGSIEINALGTSGTTAGSIEGAGTLRLGSKTLTVGYNDLSTTFSGRVQGNGGSLVKVGNGTLIVSGVSNTYTGTTTVNGGLLQVDGSIATSSLVTVNAGGTLGGTGTVASTVINGGTLAPGNSIGTISVQGNLVFSSAAAYLVEISPSAADRTNVTGAAALGGNVQVVAAPGSYRPGTTYTILSATDGVNGTFTSLTSNIGSLFLTPTLSYTPTEVLLTISQLPFNSVAQTPNQAAVADALQTGGGGTLGSAVLNLTTAEQARAAFGALSGEMHASLRSTLLDDSLYVRNAVLGRLRSASYAGASGETAALDATAPAQAYAAQEKPELPVKIPFAGPPPEPQLTFWAQGFGAWGKIDGDGNAAETRRDLAGFVTGFDRRLGNWTAGLAAGYSHANVRVDARGSSAEIDTAHLAGYLGASFGPWNLRTGAAFAWHSLDTNRTIAFPGFFDRTNARYDGNTAQAFGEIGYGMALGGVALEPFAGLALVRVSTRGFTETGGAAALTGAGNSDGVGYSSLGLRAATQYMLENGIVLRPRASLGWQHAFGELMPSAALTFASSGAAFAVAGVPIARNVALIDTGFDVDISANARLGIGYVGQLARDAQDHAVKGGFRVRF